MFIFLCNETVSSLAVSLNFPLAVKAEKLHEPRCITIEWNKAESGACFVKYDVTFKNASGHSLHTQTGYNIGGMNVCNLTAYVNITNVQLVVSFKSTSKTVTAKVSETPITTGPPTAGKKVSCSPNCRMVPFLLEYIYDQVSFVTKW